LQAEAAVEAHLVELKFKLLEDSAVEAEETVTFLLELLELQILVVAAALTVMVVQLVPMAVLE
jgi:hypothetical protein